MSSMSITSGSAIYRSFLETNLHILFPIREIKVIVLAYLQGLFNSIAYGLNSSVRRAIYERSEL